MGTDKKLRTTFNKVAELYDSIRPHYPEQLFNTIVKSAQLQEGDKLLEIGPGTGQATEPFVKMGYDITAIELGPDLADFAKEKFSGYKNLKIITGAFEEVELESSSFDLIYSATAFHWIKPEIKFSKPYDLLKSGGYLAIIHTNHTSKEREDKFFYAIQPIYKKYKPGGKYDNKICPVLEEELKPDKYDEKYFEQVFFNTYPLTISYSASEFVQLLNTYSPTISMKSEQRLKFLKEMEELINDKFDGSIDKYFAMSLSLLRKKD